MKVPSIALPMLAAAAVLLSAQSAAPKPAVPVALMRLDCGTVAANDLDAFSDTRAYVGRSKRLTASCYLIRHGDQYLLWDTGLPAAMKGKPIDQKQPMDATVTRIIVEQHEPADIAKLPAFPVWAQ